MNEAEARARKEKRKAARRSKRSTPISSGAIHRFVRDINRHARFCSTCNPLIVEPGPCEEAQRIRARFTAQGERIH